MKFCLILLISVGFGYSVLESIDYYSMEDIYINRLVYNKSDSTLFSGTLKISDKGSTYKISFTNGLPHGEYEEVLNGGDYVCKGEYLDTKSIFSSKTNDILKGDTIILDYWSEGGLESDPMHLNFYILKENIFFNQKQKKNHLKALIKNFVKDTKKMDYKYLRICFVDNVFEWKKEISFDFVKTKEGFIEDGSE